MARLPLPPSSIFSRAARTGCTSTSSSIRTFQARSLLAANHAQPRPHVRHQSTKSTPAPAISSLRIWQLFTGLLVFGVGATAWGLYEFYSTLTMWPEEVRGDLRAGIKAKNQGDLMLSQRYLRRAWETANTLPLERFAPEPYLKLSGIAITLAEVLEEHGAPQEAYQIYTEALAQLKEVAAAASTNSPSVAMFAAALEKNNSLPNPKTKGEANSGKTNRRAVGETDVSSLSTAAHFPCNGRERIRAVAIAHRLGNMAENYAQPAEDEEKWLSYAVEEALRIVADEKLLRTETDPGSAGEGAADGLVLPKWASRTDLGAPIEALGTFYARQGKPDFAFPLYQTALGMVMKGSPPPTTEDRCRGAQIMNNLADLIVKFPPQGGADGNNNYLSRAEQYADHAHQIAQEIFESARGQGETIQGETALCLHVLPVALFNLGMIYEMQGKRDHAKEAFSNSLLSSRSIGLKEGVLEAQAAVRRLERQSKANSSAARDKLDREPNTA